MADPAIERLRSGRLPDRERRDELRTLSRKRMPAAEARTIHLSNAGAYGTDRRLPDRHRDLRVQPAGALLWALAAGGRRRREPGWARHDDRRRPARLFQGAGATHGCVRTLPGGLSG